MGIQATKIETNSLGTLTDEEKLKVDKLHARLSVTNSGKHFTADNLKDTLLPLVPEPFVQRMYDEVLRHRRQKSQNVVDRVTFATFIVVVFKGSIEDRADLFCHLARSDSNPSTTSQELFRLVAAFADVYEKIALQTPEFLSWEDSLAVKDNEAFVHFLLRDLFHAKQSDKEYRKDAVPEATFVEDDVQNWLIRAPIMLRLLDIVLNHCFPLKANMAMGLPRCVVGKKRATTMLDVKTLLALNSQLPHQSKGVPWQQLFNTAVDGESFSVFANLVRKKGPTVVVVRDDEGFVFGFFASQSWEMNASFRGTAESFVFSVLPVLKIFTATGYNDHFMYLNQNQQTLPNGMGIGGQFGYFGIWIDSEFGKGSCSPTCTTFSCPQLSSRPEFIIRSLEVWAVGPKPQEATTVGRSVLDKDLGAKAMLEMVGRGPISEGLREADPTSQRPAKKDCNFMPK